MSQCNEWESWRTFDPVYNIYHRNHRAVARHTDTLAVPLTGSWPEDLPHPRTAARLRPFCPSTATTRYELHDIETV